MSKDITLLSLNYYPEDTAIGLYSTQMAEYLSNIGWNVTVITGFPYYPQWEIYDSYKKKEKYYEEVINKVRILRYKQYVPSRLSFFNRTLQILDFTKGSFFNILKIKKADIVLSVIPFTSSAWLGKKLANRLGSKHWIHIQDFEFDAAKESGLVNEKGIAKELFKLLFKVESKILNSANIVSTISNGMLRRLESKSTSQQFYLPNWVDVTFINPSLAKQHKFLKTNKYRVLYSGNIGEKQDWDFFLKVLEKFKDNKEIEFIIVGAGAVKNNLKKFSKKFSNVFHYEPVPYSELNDLLCSADLHILFQKELILDTVMPSKILGMMASGKPSLVTGNIESEVAKVFHLSKGGKYLKANDLKGVVNAILYNNFALKPSLGENAKRYIISNFSKEQVLNNFALKLDMLNNESV